ncbi:MAG: ATP-binding cassette domain-containing protein [Hoeflea sp.]|nr:ATP-binding cassette domain-containing protein [Hoeflea sp.]
MVEAESLTVQYGHHLILREIDFAAEAGSVSVIAGPNGSGKTTLLKALCGDLPHTGTIRLNGHDIRDLKPYQMAARRGVLAQETTLSFPFTVAEVVRIGISARSNPPADRGFRERRVMEALRRSISPASQDASTRNSPAASASVFSWRGFSARSGSRWMKADRAGCSWTSRCQAST